MVDPFSIDLLNPASLDVRLGDEIIAEQPFTASLEPRIVMGQMKQVRSLCHFSEKNPYLMPPGTFFLAGTIEVFNLPSNISAQFLLKSSRAREGLQHLLAGWCDPGWHGSVLTLELKNVCQYHHIPIWPGMKIGQMVFHELQHAPLKCYKSTGRYNGDKAVTASKGHA